MVNGRFSHPIRAGGVGWGGVDAAGSSPLHELRIEVRDSLACPVLTVVECRLITRKTDSEKNKGEKNGTWAHKPVVL